MFVLFVGFSRVFHKWVPVGDHPGLFKPDIMFLSKTGVSFNSVWIELGRRRRDFDNKVPLGDLPSYSNQISCLCRGPVCHLVQFGFNSGDADGILTNGCL